MHALFKPNFSQKLALIVYSTVWLLIMPLAIVHFIFQLIRRKPGYTIRRLSRYGLEFSPEIQPHGLIIHCASVGEVVAIQNLVEQILHLHPNLFITITTNTTTGADRVKFLFDDKVSHAYLPYDFPLFIKLFLKRRAPSKVLINEMELWPNLCDQCWRANIPILIINGRMSQKSTKTYQKYPSLFQPMFTKLTMICAQGQRDYQNYQALGVSANKLILTNNIKFDLTISDQDIINSQRIREDLGLDGRIVLVAGSTHEPEEQVLLDAFLTLSLINPALLLVIVPRHPQRFDKVKQLLDKQHIQTILMSQSQQLKTNTQVILCDQMGTLRSLYALADMCFVGGSIAKKGGHNALEPAAFGVPILMGESTFNNPAICQALAEKGALETVNNAEQIANICKRWLQEPQARFRIGQAGKHVLNQNSGAVRKTLDILEL